MTQPSEPRELSDDERRALEAGRAHLETRRAEIVKPEPPQPASAIAEAIVERLPEPTPADPPASVCPRCDAPRRTERPCDDGWVAVTPLAQGYDPAMARCRQWAAKLEADGLAQGLESAALADDRFREGWDDLEIVDQAWRASRMLGQRVREVVRDGLNVIMTGKVGTGKSHAAILICRDAIAAGLTAVRVDWPKLLDALKDAYSDKTLEREGKRIERLVRADLLLLDDLAAGEKDAENDFSRSRLDKVISRRYDRGLPTIVTANFTPSQLSDVLGERAASRIRQHVMDVRFGGKQYRSPDKSTSTTGLVADIWREVHGHRPRGGQA